MNIDTEDLAKAALGAGAVQLLAALRPVGRFRKDCNCDAPASTNALRRESSFADGTYTETVTLEPGPSCDQCGKPWRKVE